MLLNNGDCIEVMQRLIDDGVQVDSVVTDPPYHLTSIVERFGKEGSAPVKVNEFFNKENGESKGSSPYKRASTGFMGKEWDGGDIAFRQETWELAYKLLKPGGHLLAFSASRNYHRMAVAIEDAGFEIRDQIMWIYGSGFPKSLNIGKGVDKKQGNDREIVGQNSDILKKQAKDLREGKRKILDSLNSGAPDRNNGFSNVSADITKGNSEYEGWGTALKPAHEPIVMARKPLSEKSIVDNVLKHRTGGINIDGCRVGNEERTHKGMSSLGVMHDDDWKPKDIEVTSKGRFPANVMHDGSDVVKDIFPNSKGFVSNGDAKVGEYSKGVINPMRRGNATSYGDDGSAARYFYCPKVSKEERNNADTNTHPTVKPIELMKYLCRLVTPKGGTVLDPFMGSGSTGMAAKNEGFDFIGIEKEKEYFEIAQSRIKVTAPLMEFFS